VLALENAMYSVITPEGCASILWRDGSRAEEAAGVLKITSTDLLRFGIIDEVVPEPLGGAHQDWDAAAQLLKTTVLRCLAELTPLSAEQLITQRIEKFRGMGFVASA
jgi:acetyl-CoA carboxylase carboxyl transferase subunit alpha